MERPGRPRPRWRTGLAAAVLVALLAGCGPEDAPVQSDHRPKGLDIIDTVKAAGSDGKARRFQREGLAKAVKLASESFRADVIAKRFAELQLDVARLDVVEKTAVRVYFVGEASGYNNSLGVNLEGVGLDEGKPQLVFPSPYTRVNLYDSAKHINPDTNTLDESKFGERDDKNPVLPGDFVDLGSVPAGAKLSFFLIADNRRGDVRVYTPLPERNPDGIAHMVAIAMEDSPYLILSFEDMFKGGDKDYSDCVVVVEMSAYNIQAMLGNIDPLRQAKRIALLVFLIGVPVGGPLGFLAARKALRIARARKAVREAEQLLASAQPDKAVSLLEEARAHCDAGQYEALDGLRVAGLEQLHDAAGLLDVYYESPEAFESRENPSLEVARAQIETEHFDAFQDLRAKWREREGAHDRWLALDVDAQEKQGKDEQGLAILQSDPKTANAAPALMARYALLICKSDQAKAGAFLARALQLAPRNPDVRVIEGRVKERLRDTSGAEAAYSAALTLAPKDPFVREAAAEFHRRQGALRKALEVWCAGLAPPSMDFIWTQTLFWSRAAHPVAVDWDALKAPRGELHPLIDFMCAIPPGEFWDPHRFEPLAQSHPNLLARQDVFWLQLLQALKKGREDEALSLLNLGRFGERSWYEELEVALLRILQFRRLGFMDPKLATPPPTDRPGHPLFAALDAWTRGENPEGLESIQKLVRTDEVFSAACLAAGWCEAGLQLRRIPLVAGQFPPRFLKDVHDALRQNRGEDHARQFAKEAGLQG